jgi:hypothetical protein
MLSQILHLLKTAETPLSLDRLSQQLAVERSALEAMLEHLVQKGKIEMISSTSKSTDEKQPFSFCAGCQTKTYCAGLIETPVYYTLNQSRK